MKKPIILFIFGSFVMSGYGYSGGTGEFCSPYEISSVTDLQTLMLTSADWDKVFVLTSDLNVANIQATPIGNANTRFSGLFFGNRKTIKNLRMSQSSINSIGLFGSISDSGKVSSLILLNPRVTGKNIVGCLCGVNLGTISNCKIINGITDGNNNLGGLVGQNSGFITNCTCDAKITSVLTGKHASRYGGFVGCNSDGTIIGCSSSCNIECLGVNVGGFCGLNYKNSTIESCNCSGKIEAGSYVGGFCGYNKKSQINYSSAEVNSCARQYVAGFIGINDTSSVITNCIAFGYSYCDTAFATSGGFVALNRMAMVNDCVANGNSSAKKLVGGFVGACVGGTLTNCLAFGNYAGNSDIGPFIGSGKHGYSLVNCNGFGHETPLVEECPPSNNN